MNYILILFVLIIILYIIYTTNNSINCNQTIDTSKVHPASIIIE